MLERTESLNIHLQYFALRSPRSARRNGAETQERNRESACTLMFPRYCGQTEKLLYLSLNLEVCHGNLQRSQDL